MTDPYATVLIGVDIGGTDTKIAVLDSDRRGVAHAAHLPTRPADPPEATFERIALTIAGAELAGARTMAIGVAFPGNVDRRRCKPSYVPALGDHWVGSEVGPILTAALSPLGVAAVAVINDVQAMTVAEWRLGAARGHHTILCVAVGTGVGGGLVIGGRLHHGVDDTAGSIGHTTVDPDGEACMCGNTGCLERYASGPAIAAAAGTETAAEAAHAAMNGDECSIAAIDRAARALGIAIGNVCTMLTPTMIVIGGGVAGAGPILLDRVRAEAHRRVRVASIAGTSFVTAEFGPMAGAVGAALMMNTDRDDLSNSRECIT